MTASPWTQDRIDRLKTLWLEGVSAERIARDLAHGISRSAVLGKAHRLGLSSGRPTVKASAPVRPGPLVDRPAGVSPRPQARPMHPALLRPTTTDALEAGQATLLSVRRCQCRWPLGDPLVLGFSLCGRRVSRGAYCEPHAGVAYRTRRDTPQTLERLARLT